MLQDKVSGGSVLPPHTFSVAPMLDWTDMSYTIGLGVFICTLYVLIISCSAQ